jgi:hypothetical protein
MDDQPQRSETPLILCFVATICGAVLGAVTNLIDGHVSRDYFAITMGCDWNAGAGLAVSDGAVAGTLLGLFFGALLAIAVSASTRLRCPPWLALRAFCEALAIVMLCWLAGGMAGATLARLWPRLWGFHFVGVPPRVNLSRFAWVGGTIWGAYGGTMLALNVCCVRVHLRWRRMSRSVSAFEVLSLASMRTARMMDEPMEGE